MSAAAHDRRQGLPWASPLALAMAAFLTILTEALPAGLLPQMAQGLAVSEAWVGKTFRRVLIVALAEATPVHEAERLQDDLRRAGIEPFAWVINQSLLASGTHDPVLQQRGAYKVPFIAHVRGESAKRAALVAWRRVAPVGEAALLDLAAGRVG